MTLRRQMFALSLVHGQGGAQQAPWRSPDPQQGAAPKRQRPQPPTNAFWLRWAIGMGHRGSALAEGGEVRPRRRVGGHRGQGVSSGLGAPNPGPAIGFVFGHRDWIPERVKRAPDRGCLHRGGGQ